jgi:elongator complex protein 4
MSSFKRKVKVTDTGNVSKGTVSNEGAQESQKNVEIPELVSVDITGIKPWIHNGQSIVSTGHRQLDELIGGGIPLGTINLYLLESCSTYGQTLVNYNIAESVSHNHTTLLIYNDGFEAESLLKSIPYNGTIGSAANQGETEEDNEAAEKADHGLKIAWQYEKYLRKSR